MLRNALLSVAVCAGCLLAGEWIVRWVAPQDLVRPNREIWRPDETIGWRHVESTDTRINTGERTARFLTDADGYRIGKEGAVAIDSADLALLLIGDSFVEATAVNYERSFAGILDSLLERRTGLSVRVVNDGVGGWDPNQYLRETDIALSGHRYDLAIVFLYVGNDLVSRRQYAWSPDIVSQRHPFRLPRSLSIRELRDALVYPIHDELKTRSQLWMLFKRANTELAARLGLIDDRLPEKYRLSAGESVVWDVTSSVAHDVEARFAEFGIPVLFVLLPDSFQVYPEIWRSWIRSVQASADSVDLLLPNRLLSSAFEKRGMALYDALAFLRETARDGEPLYGTVDRHFSPAGHQAMAEYLLEVVVESGVL